LKTLARIPQRTTKLIKKKEEEMKQITNTLMNFCVDYEQLHAFMKKHIHHCVRNKCKKSSKF
jgi:hypothetical protein